MRSTMRLTSRVTNPRSRVSSPFRGGIVAQEFIGQPDRTQRKTDCVPNVSALRDGEFATAAPKIHHQRRKTIHARAGDQSQVNQARLFHARDDLHAPAGRRPHPFQECLRIARIPQGAGRHHAHAVGHDLLRGPVEAAQHFYRFCHGIGSQESGTKNTFAEARDFAVFVQGAQTARLQARNFQPHRVRADIDCRKCGHGEASQCTCARQDRHRFWRGSLRGKSTAEKITLPVRSAPPASGPSCPTCEIVPLTRQPVSPQAGSSAMSRRQQPRGGICRPSHCAVQPPVRIG